MQKWEISERSISASSPTLDEETRILAVNRILHRKAQSRYVLSENC
jgi:hypothetical protein